MLFPVIVNSNGIGAVNITTQSTSLLLYNAYMPCDIRSNDDLYCDMFSEIMSVCNIMNCSIMNCSNFNIGGDLNTSFQRALCKDFS